MIESVFLDAGGVLLGPRHDLVSDALSPLGVRPDARTLDRCHYAGVAAEDRHDVPPEEIWPTYFRAFAREAGVGDDKLDEAIDRLWDAFRMAGAWGRALPGAREAVADIAAWGRPIVVVSNSEGTVEADLRDAGVCQVGAGGGVEVLKVIDSSVVGVWKPDPGIFRIALEAAGVTPDRAVHVGDLIMADVRGAEAAGVRPLHLDPYGFCPHPDGHEHVSSLADVVRVLEGEG